jgi:predicted phage terminase large subunit-like protein
METPDPELQAILRTDLAAFIQKVFHTVAPGDVYRHNWHLEAIAYELERCGRGESTRLLITQPPRTLKSICTSVAFVAWALGHDPALRFLCVSYSQDLALDLARKLRLVLESPWYRATFPGLRLRRNTEAEVTTTQGGGRLATSIGGTLTGRGADVIVIDDPLKAEEAQSEVARNRVIDWYQETLLSRFNHPPTGRLVLVMQRLHEEDLAGHVAAGWRHLDLPAIAVERQEIELGHGLVRVREPGDLLDPVRMPQDVLERMSAEIGTLAFSAQYQQRPTPVEGNLVRRAWFQTYDALPAPENRRVVQSWDVAGTTGGDYSVCTTWFVAGKHTYLRDVWRDRLEFPQLKRKVVQLAQRHGAQTVLIEKAGLGLSLYQDLRDAPGIGSVVPCKVEADKVVRLEAETAAIEGGYVHLPRDAPWLANFLNELLAFPNGRFDDQVDSVSQFLAYLRRGQRQTPSIGLGAKLFVGDGPDPSWA